jgi:hypothetical protein
MSISRVSITRVDMLAALPRGVVDREARRTLGGLEASTMW